MVETNQYHGAISVDIIKVKIHVHVVDQLQVLNLANSISCECRAWNPAQRRAESGWKLEVLKYTVHGQETTALNFCLPPPSIPPSVRLLQVCWRAHMCLKGRHTCSRRDTPSLIFLSGWIVAQRPCPFTMPADRRRTHRIRTPVR